MAAALEVLRWTRDHVVGSLFSGSVVAFVLWLRTRPGKLVIGLAPAEHGTARSDANARGYRHLVVSNTRRASPAHHVRVYLTRVAEVNDGEEVVLYTSRFPVPY